MECLHKFKEHSQLPLIYCERCGCSRQLDHKDVNTTTSSFEAGIPKATTSNADTAQQLSIFDGDANDPDLMAYKLMREAGVDANDENAAEARRIIAEHLDNTIKDDFTDTIPPPSDDAAWHRAMVDGAPLLESEPIELGGTVYEPHKVPVDLDTDDTLPSAGL